LNVQPLIETCPGLPLLNNLLFSLLVIFIIHPVISAVAVSQFILIAPFSPFIVILDSNSDSHLIVIFELFANSTQKLFFDLILDESTLRTPLPSTFIKV